MRQTLARARADASRASAGALLHGLGATAVGAAMLSESRVGYRFPVFDGPKEVLGFLPDPITGWGAGFLFLGVAVLALRTHPLARAALAALAGAFAVYAGSSLTLGLTSVDAATVGGVTWALAAADAARAALAYGPPHAPHAGSPTRDQG